MSKFEKMIKEKVETKMPKANAPKETFSKNSTDFLTAEEKSVVTQGIIAKKLRQGLGQELSDADKYGLEKLAQTKAPTLSADLVDLVIESDILSPDLAKDMWSQTTLGKILPMQEVEDLALAVTIDNLDASMRVIGEGQDSKETTNTFNKMKHFVYDIGGYASYSYLAENRSIIDIASNKLGALQNSWARAVESFAINGNNAGTHPDANFGAGDADIVEKFGKGLRFIAKEKETVDFGGASLSDDNLIKYIQEMGLKGGVYLDPNAVANNEVALLVTQGLYLRMARAKDVFQAVNPQTNDGQVARFMGVPVYMSSYMPQKTNATGVVDAVGANNTFDSAIMINKNFFKMYTYGSPIVETDRNIINKTKQITLSGYVGCSGLFDSLNETFPVDTTRKYATYGVNINVA
jgi:hypothetical protein